MTELVDYLAENAGHAFSWGKHDCVHFACDWVLARTGRDPLSQWRGRYHDEGSANNNLISGGGLLQLCERAFHQCGFSTVSLSECQTGDVGMVMATHGLTMAILNQRNWICRGENGIVSGPFRAIRIWRIL
jgi:hypothetical protein